MPAPDIFNNTTKVSHLDHKELRIHVECTYGITPDKCVVLVYEYWHDRQLDLVDILDTNHDSLFDVLPPTAVAVLELHLEKVFRPSSKADDHLSTSDLSRHIYLEPYVHEEDRTDHEGGLA